MVHPLRRPPGGGELDTQDGVCRQVFSRCPVVTRIRQPSTL